MKELEKAVDYESFMRECLARESVYTTKISSLEIPGLPVGSFGAVEQTASARAKATLLVKAPLERVANEQHARKKAEGLAGEKKTKIVERHVHHETARVLGKWRWTTEFEVC